MKLHEPLRRRRRSRHRFRSIPALPDPHEESGFPQALIDAVDPHVQRPAASSTSTAQNAEGCGIENDCLQAVEDEETSSVGENEGDFVEGSGDLMHHTESDGSSAMDTPESIPQSKTTTGISNWRVLWSIIMTRGSRRLTKNQYQSIRVIMEVVSGLGTTSWSNSCDEMAPQSLETRYLKTGFFPHYSTLQKWFKNEVLHAITPHLLDIEVPVSLDKAGAVSKTVLSTGNPTTPVKIILPSEYARADLSTPEVFAEMHKNSLECIIENAPAYESTTTTSNSECVDLLPLISARKWFYGQPKTLGVDKSVSTGSNTSFAEIGDVVAVSALHTGAITEELERCFRKTAPQSSRACFLGTVEQIWTVHHRKRLSDPEFALNAQPGVSERDRCVARMLSAAIYTSPLDSCSAPVVESAVSSNAVDIDDGDEIPEATGIRKKKLITPEVSEASKRRRLALRERKKRMEDAWREWSKPPVKPGDVISMLRPCTAEELRQAMDSSIFTPSTATLTENDRNSRMLVVSRFWTEREERSRHILWIRGGTDVEDCAQYWFESTTADYSTLFAPPIPNSSYLHIDVRSVHLVSMHPGPRGPETYTPISSFGKMSSGELYFVYRFILYWDGFRIQSTNCASGEGIYLLCLNLPRRSRSTPSAVRIICATPPGVGSEAILKGVIDDIVHGSTEGFVDFDANGRKRRIFLDLVGFLGDTPALNALLDVLGHTANAFCHLCRFSRHSSSVVGSRYSAQPPAGSHASAARSYYQHTAVRDCGAKEGTCRALGIKPEPTEAHLTIHSIRSALSAARARIPKTSNGLPVVPGLLDPYRASFVAPDHLLTGHLKDCINLVFKLLPSRKLRMTSESFILGFLHDCGLPAQNRLLDHDKKSLYTMSMTELYAMSLVAEIGFRKACDHEESMQDSSSIITVKCRSAIDIVASCSKLISILWYEPNPALEGDHAFRSHGDYLAHIQNVASEHIQKVSAICSMPDSDFYDLENARVDRLRKAMLSKLHDQCTTAIRTLDKPNVHRIYELVYCTLPMLGHVSLLGELVLEKTHQVLKRAIKQSNNRDIQMHAMREAAMNDWQGRLTTVEPLLRKESETGLRACFRLLHGREELAKLDGKLGEFQKRQVRLALGPNLCVLQELYLQGKSVISSGSTMEPKVQWKLKGEIETVSSSYPCSNGRENVLRYFQEAYNFPDRSHVVRIANIIASTFSNSTSRRCFAKGDVLQILALASTDHCSHFPFVMQRSAFTRSVSTNLHFSTSLWCVLSILSVTRTGGQTDFYIAVLPCVEVVSEEEERAMSLPKIKLRGQHRVSFAKMDASVSKIGVIHDCGPQSCTPHPSRRTVRHVDGAEPIQGAVFFALTAKNGYPPRSG